MNFSTGLLFLMSPSVSRIGGDRAEKVREQALRGVHDAISNETVLSGIVLLGNLTETGAAEEFEALEDVVNSSLEACLDIPGAQDLPPVIAVPGPGDAAALNSPMITDVLGRNWNRFRQDFWQGGDSALESAFEECYGNFTRWYEGYRPGNASVGKVPGDLFTRFEASGKRIGILSLNTSFRELGNVDSSLLLDEGQIRACTGQGVQELGSSLDLLVIAASRSARCEGFDDAATFLVAPQAGTEHAGEWLIGADVCVPSCPVASFTELDATSWQLSGTDNSVKPRTRYRLSGFRRRNEIHEEAPEQPEATREQDLAELSKDLKSGQMVLVLVSGIEKESVNPEGEALWSLDELRAHLERQSGVYEPTSLSMAEIHRSARLRSGTHELLRRALLSDPEHGTVLGDHLLRGPWLRIYDCTGSNVLKEAVRARNNRSLGAEAVDSTKQKPGSTQDKLRVIGLNGFIAESESNTTLNFDMAQRGPDMRSLWLRQFESDLASYPVLILAQDASSPILKEYLRLLPDVASGGNRRKAYMIAEGENQELRILRETKSIVHIRDTPKAALSSYLNRGSSDVLSGLHRIQALRDDESSGTGIRRVSSLLERGRMLVQAGKSRGYRFLSGHAPEWSDIIANVPAHMSQVDEVVGLVRRSGHEKPIILISERAGSGKTTNLMRIAMLLSESFPRWNTGWIDRNTDLRVSKILDQVRKQRYDAVLIDDVDIFGSYSSELLHQINQDRSTLVIGTIRQTRMSALSSRAGFKVASNHGNLEDQDLESLIDALYRGGALGTLNRVRPRSAQVYKLRQEYGKNLLVTMHQVVTGSKFEEKIAHELNDLGRSGKQDLRHVYAIMCMFNAWQNERPSIQRDALNQIASYQLTPSLAAQAIDWLLERDMIVEDQRGYIKCRHVVFAEGAIEELRSTKSLLGTSYTGEILKDLLLFYANRAGHIRDRQHPDRRVMVRLLDHDKMRGIPDGEVRDIYERVQPILQGDLHYWLQYGSFEREKKNIDRAMNLLETAHSCNGGSDHFQVLTALNGARLESSLDSPSDAMKNEAAKKAFRELQNVIRKNGKITPHTYHHLISLGGKWVRSSPLLGREERLEFAQSVMHCIDEARRWLGDNTSVDSAIRDNKGGLESLMRELSSGGEDDWIPV